MPIICQFLNEKFIVYSAKKKIPYFFHSNQRKGNPFLKHQFFGMFSFWSHFNGICVTIQNLIIKYDTQHMELK